MTAAGGEALWVHLAGAGKTHLFEHCRPGFFSRWPLPSVAARNFRKDEEPVVRSARRGLSRFQLGSLSGDLAHASRGSGGRREVSVSGKLHEL